MHPKTNCLNLAEISEDHFGCVEFPEMCIHNYCYRNNFISHKIHNQQFLSLNPQSPQHSYE